MRKTPRLSLEQLTPYLLEVPEVGQLVWRDVFGNDHPVEIEVGFGKGLFLLRAALTRPEVNFLGIEIMRKYQLFTATRMAKRQLENVRLLKADARPVLRDRVPEQSLQAVHVYFPDPWWKKRHHKRRLFTAEFAEPCERVLRPGGRLHIATDVPEYFEVMKGLIAERASLQPLPAPAEGAPADDLDYLSNFERKKRKAGLPIYRGVWQRH